MKVLLEAYGCAQNRGEAREFAGRLTQAGHLMVSEPWEADALVLFTCGVIGATERHMLKRVGELSRHRGKPLLVCGCLPEICPEKISGLAPDAMLFGPANSRGPLDVLGIESSRGFFTMPSSVGILPIASGCTGACTYCVTKLARGSLCSRPPDELRRRLECLLAAGAAEVQICAQDTAAYGLDIGTGLGGLVGELEKAEGDFMLRIGMMNPSTLMSRAGDVMAAFESPKVFKFLHLPVQSGSDAVLKRMARGHSAQDFTDLVERFRARFPGLALSTDIIVGFPGETDEDFRKSADLMDRICPDIINVTRFSPRPGTEAYSMDSMVPGRTAKARSRAMTDLRFRLTGRNYARMKGRTVRALATERRVEGTTFLRTAEYKPVVVRAELELGSWHRVKITGARRTHLSGKC